MTPLPAAARRFCDRFGTTAPIVNAPMAFVAGGALAAAVAAAGGLGVIGGGYGDESWIEQQRRMAGDPSVAVGLITWSVMPRLGLVERLLDGGVRTLFLSFGDPAPIIARRHGARVICQVQSVAEAVAAADAGADAIVVQGNEAGGHGRDNEPVHTLAAAAIPSVAPLPVLVAGGAVDGVDLADAWRIGAAGVVMGTRFVATDEALAFGAAKERLVAAGQYATVRTSVFDQLRGPVWPAGYAGRALRNATTARWHGNEDALERSLHHACSEYRRRAHDPDVGVVWAGTGVDRVQDVPPAAELVESVMAQALLSSESAHLGDLR